MIENEWSFAARNIYVREASVNPAIRKINFSMACNHCSDPVCLNGCPSKAYYKDPHTGSVVSDSHKCIGCRYCNWNCPYDAPKFNKKIRVIEKCHFCNHRLSKGLEPACATACPTGALGFGEIPEGFTAGSYSWLPEKGLDPALMLLGTPWPRAVKLVPRVREHVRRVSGWQSDDLKSHWSLVLFSFIIMCAVSINISFSAGSQSISIYIPPVMLLIAGAFSLLHLNSPFKAWKSLLNPLSSPLSREIVLYIIYTLLVIAELIYPVTALRATVIVTGFILLIAIDHVYNYADRTRLIMMHSGQVFLSSLLVSSFLMNSTVPFIFIAFLKLFFNLYTTIKQKQAQPVMSLRFLRIALLLIISMIIVTKAMINEFAGLILLFSGELIDRILYYIDFDPVSIKKTINEPTIMN